MKGASNDIGGKEMFSASDANAIGGVTNLRRLKVHRLSLGNRGKKKISSAFCCQKTPNTLLRHASNSVKSLY